MNKRNIINREQVNPRLPLQDAPAIPPWRTELAKNFVVGDRLAHEEFARFMVLVFCDNLLPNLRPWAIR